MDSRSRKVEAFIKDLSNDLFGSNSENVILLLKDLLKIGWNERISAHDALDLKFSNHLPNRKHQATIKDIDSQLLSSPDVLANEGKFYQEKIPLENQFQQPDSSQTVTQSYVQPTQQKNYAFFRSIDPDPLIVPLPTIQDMCLK
uniref:Uncharacterized protein n=1 Tax=Acrobeloides nanus TaxID=290746 RepID=A0A914C5F5_9BILA